MKKIKPILPSLREKQRYILFEIISDKNISKKEAYDAVKKACLDYNGELGLAKAGFLPLDYWKNQKGVIRVNSKGVDNIKAALTMATNINKKKIMIRSIKTSGLINKLG